ncbi:DUF2442 domain-containing protein [Leptolyngbya ohadii]|uniref:DUF2442 domain-containing protein n=1 Tax=Leptolyngbya ohadii TaxID=1962290 RepID=UPI000B599BC2|nr:DUF2442 domain-containing protein [Leptolyngbya ohadii]
MATKVSDRAKKVSEQIAAARANAACVATVNPRAISAKYNRKTKKIAIQLSNGVDLAFPAEYGQGLQGASPEELAEVEITPSGLGLHWESLDADLSIPELFSGVFGTKAWMAEFSRKGGTAKSPAKSQSARENGKKGGRPRKQPVLA